MKWAMLLALFWPLTMCCCPSIDRTTELPPEGGGYEMASAGETAVLCTDAETREKVRTLLLDALDQALTQHFILTFKVWMSDSRDQPGRAALGVRNGVAAYLDARKKMLIWSPMDCPAG
jgi:hypothetical protein